jgi:cytochrome c553
MPSQKLKQNLKTSRALAAAALLFFGFVAAPASFAQPAPPVLAQGCIACHGPSGNSQISQFPSLAGQPKVFLENQLVLIREGLRDIPAMKGMLVGVKDRELVSLAQYFAAQKPVRAESPPVKPEVYERGKAISRAMLCGTCHLPDYTGREQIPRLAGQQEEFLVYSMKQFRDHAGPGRDTIMSASLFGLKDDDLSDIAHFLANFK